MAFVYKAERELLTNNSQISLGPGEYLPLSDMRIYKINKKPFLCGDKYISKKKNDVPGPGAYYQDDMLIHYLKNVQNEKISKQNDKIYILSEKGNIEKSNALQKGFNTKAKRFIDISHKERIPGPGQYLYLTKEENKSKNLRNWEKKEILSKKKILFQKIKEFQRIPSIPSRIKKSHTLSS